MCSLRRCGAAVHALAVLALLLPSAPPAAGAFVPSLSSAASNPLLGFGSYQFWKEERPPSPSVGVGVGTTDIRQRRPASVGGESALGGWFGRGGGESSITTTEEVLTVNVGEHVGSGSYGTVHVCTLARGRGGNGGDDEEGSSEVDRGGEVYIAKRAWTYEELKDKAEKAAGKRGKSKDSSSLPLSSDSGGVGEVPSSASGGLWMASDENIRERADRCAYYIDVERHCLTKLNAWFDNEGEARAGRECITKLEGTYSDKEGREWLVFRLVARGDGYGEGRGQGNGNGDGEGSSSSSPRPAISLADAMDLDWVDQHARDPDAGDEQHHHLYIVQREMGLPSNSTFADTLDAILIGLLRATAACHGGNVVHRDVKPQNLLCDSAHGGFVLIDFGSAADMDPRKGVGRVRNMLGRNGGRVGLEDSSRVAVSPIYAAPETFVRWDREPLNFDTFSCALIFCQLLFNLLDERTDAAFHQQLDYAKYDLDTWLDREFSATLLPEGLDDAFAYLAERRGLWQLLKDMLNSDPELRASSNSAYFQFKDLLLACKQGESIPAEEADGEFFASFLSSVELYKMPPVALAAKGESGRKEPKEVETSVVVIPEEAFVVPRPLHYVASFDRSLPLGLVLSEVDPDEDYDGEDDPDARAAWERSTRAARPGEVYIKGITEDGQADGMGIFEIGDRLRSVGEVPVAEGGFERVVSMLGRQPNSAKTVKLHFDRRSVRRAHKYEKGSAHKGKVVGQGAWSSIGRRNAQEDAFVLHEIHDGQYNDLLMAGIFDGHGGKAASTTASQLLPSLFAAELASATSIKSGGKAASSDVRTALEKSWDITCNTYRDGCSGDEVCVADYDPREGIVSASMSSSDLVAGTTAVAAVLSVAEEGAEALTVLNCGDSRALVVGRLRGAPKEDRLHHESVVHFSTRDHNPGDELEMERLLLGKEKGYSQPNRSLAQCRLKVGDYQYALSRSLEGPFATSKGIVSDPDVYSVDLVEMLAEREGGVLVIASDGLFEVMDNEQVGREVLKMREGGVTANDVAKRICGMANKRGTSDNVSAVVVYLE